MADVGLVLEAPRARRARPQRVLALFIVLSLVALDLWAIYERKNRAPFQPASLNMQLSLSVVPVAQLQPAIQKLGLRPSQLQAMLPLVPGQQAVVGQLHFVLPAKIPAGSQLVLFAVDERTHRAVQWFWGWSPGSQQPTSGWDGSFSGFAGKYPWLAALAALGPDQPDSRAEVSIPLEAKSPLTFYAALDRDALPLVDLNKDFLFAVGFVGPQRQIYWAQRLHATAGL